MKILTQKSVHETEYIRMMNDRIYYTYILANDAGMLYIGVTNDLFRRLAEHRSGKGGCYTSRYQCHRLVYFETDAYICNAIDREKEWKKWSRKKKIALINQLNPSWKDLSDIISQHF